ncbi:hypothetical protein KEJ19_08420 [Candidatus Bathyarchaeota archaeon]|nr:hypothetical protein [Candidatus Bathyarchaeota archaeon]
MEISERVWAVLRGKEPDRIPWLIYSNHLPRGSFERRMRNLGLGLDVRCRVHRTFMPHVRVESKVEGNYSYTVYRTPVGELSSKTRIGLSFQLPEQGSWIVEHPVKGLEDLRILKFMMEDTVYEPQYETFLQLEEELEGDGIVTVGADYTPLMKLIVSFMGFRNFALVYGRHPEAIEEILEVLDNSYMEMYRIIAASPAKIVRIGDNVDGVMISPKIFEKYLLPYYNKYCDLLKAKGKVVISHMDGRLRTLKDLIGRTRLDAVEAFTPPPMGDLPIREARETWKDKVLWLNFPEEVFLRSPTEIRKYTLGLLREMAPGLGFIVSITEDVHPSHFRKAIETVTETFFEYGAIPIRASELPL